MRSARFSPRLIQTEIRRTETMKTLTPENSVRGVYTGQRQRRCVSVTSWRLSRRSRICKRIVLSGRSLTTRNKGLARPAGRGTPLMIVRLARVTRWIWVTHRVHRASHEPVCACRYLCKTAWCTRLIWSERSESAWKGNRRCSWCKNAVSSQIWTIIPLN